MLPSKRILTELIGSVYDAASDATLWEAFLGRLAQTSRAGSAALVIHELGPELHTLAATWMVDPEASRLYQKHYGSLDVWAIRGRSKPPGYVCTSESLCVPQELAGTEIYNDLLVRYGIVHGMFGLVENDASRRWGSVSLYRGASSDEFQMSDLETLNFLIPHIRRAFVLHFRFSELKARTQGIETALNLLATGVIFVGANGEIVLMNSKADELLRQGDGLLLGTGRLKASVDAETTRLKALIFGATQTGNGIGLSAGATIFISRKARRPLCVTVAPLRNFNVGLGQQPSAVLFVSDPDQRVELPADLLRRCHGLTRAEARLAMILVEGRSLKEAADLCGVTHNTAKSQLKNIFVKTNVERQSELVKLLLISSGCVQVPSA
jgi:DNA-binding CsgD family transcriptional regulator